MGFDLADFLAEEEESSAKASGAHPDSIPGAVRAVPERVPDLLPENKQGAWLLPMQQGQNQVFVRRRSETGSAQDEKVERRWRRE